MRLDSSHEHFFIRPWAALVQSRDLRSLFSAWLGITAKCLLGASQQMRETVRIQSSLGPDSITAHPYSTVPSPGETGGSPCVTRTRDLVRHAARDADPLPKTPDQPHSRWREKGGSRGDGLGQRESTVSQFPPTRSSRKLGEPRSSEPFTQRRWGKKSIGGSTSWR